MPDLKKMQCSDCGTEMNYHAEKLDLTAGLTEPQDIDPVFGGVIEDTYTCPDCGKTTTRRVKPSRGSRE